MPDFNSTNPEFEKKQVPSIINEQRNYSIEIDNTNIERLDGVNIDQIINQLENEE